jgi:magnesium-transporting ATPase (P-type)
MSFANIVVLNMRRYIKSNIAGREVVRDDIVLIAEGDRVPADAVLLTGSNISVDESLLLWDFAWRCHIWWGL